MKNLCKGMFPASIASGFAIALMSFLPSCELLDTAGSEDYVEPVSDELQVSPSGIASLLSELPLTIDQVKEVWSAVSASSENGYDEEYTFQNLVQTPGSGVGDGLLNTKAEVGVSGNKQVSERQISSCDVSLRDLISKQVKTSMAAESPLSTKSSGTSSDFMDELSSSGLQIYWPYSEDWDGETLPAITFNPGTDALSNKGYLREQLPSGSWIVKEITVDEDYARTHPLWIINTNEDSSFLTVQMAEKLEAAGMLEASLPETKASSSASSDFMTLRLKEIKTFKNFDPFWAGGSEIFIKCGSIKGFTAEVIEDLSRYSPEITDLMINVKRKQVLQTIRFNTVLAAEWSSQLENCCFLMIEDDGGKRTSWKCSGSVKIKSKSWGYDVEFPLNINDDIIWRGKLSESYFLKYNGQPNRLGEASVTFTLQ